MYKENKGGDRWGTCTGGIRGTVGGHVQGE